MIYYLNLWNDIGYNYAITPTHQPNNHHHHFQSLVPPGKPSNEKPQQNNFQAFKKHK